ncbi:hypothetical protein [Kitasatospora sp. NBC_01539]|uniref:hypothetical protein n=1 Tax=Kitasatospora sp. NBC_01539 TaxID=2903577 RepID=UPI00386025E2
MPAILRGLQRVLSTRTHRTGDVQLCEQCSTVSDAASRAQERRRHAEALRAAYGPRV